MTYINVKNAKRQRTFKEFRKRAIKDILYFIFCGLVFTGIVHKVTPYVVRTEHKALAIVKYFTPQKVDASTLKLVSPIPHLDITLPSAPPTPTPEEDTIESYINKVFGDDSWRAFKLLSCENSTHNADTVNMAGNYPQGSRDIGVFQINEYWQSVNPKFLFNWKINIQIAKQLFDENNGTFSLWTCGRKLGI